MTNGKTEAIAAARSRLAEDEKHVAYLEALDPSKISTSEEWLELCSHDNRTKELLSEAVLGLFPDSTDIRVDSFDETTTQGILDVHIELDGFSCSISTRGYPLMQISTDGCYRYDSSYMKDFRGSERSMVEYSKRLKAHAPWAECMAIRRRDFDRRSRFYMHMLWLLKYKFERFDYARWDKVAEELAEMDAQMEKDTAAAIERCNLRREEFVEKFLPDTQHLIASAPDGKKVLSEQSIEDIVEILGTFSMIFKH